jgi:translation elongation factor P/translation initiation factor 5A
MGVGEREEMVVGSALGSGQDGLNADYSGSNNPDGRHFQLSFDDLVENRTKLYLNNVLLNGFEDTISTNAFDSRFDYRVEPGTGRVELQRAFLQDQGGAYYAMSTSNTGDGTVAGITLLDDNAPAETWTFRATSVIRDAYGDPVSGVSKFTAVGSVSGTLLDANGNVYTFMTDGGTYDNGVIQLAITEGATPFDRGDRFTVKVSSRVLVRGDVLEARYIANQDLEDPEFFTDANKLYAKHGSPAIANPLLAVRCLRIRRLKLGLPMNVVDAHRKVMMRG